MKTFFKIIGVLILLGAALSGYIFYMGSSRGPVIEQRVTDFLRLASANDIDRAYEFFTDNLKEALPKEEFREIVADHFREFSFLKQSQDSYFFSIKASKRNIFDLTRFYEYEGTVAYTAGREGKIKAVFMKENGEWELIAFRIGDPYIVY